VRDTSREARDLVFASLRKLSPATRLALACESSDELRALTADGIRYRHPELTPGQVADAARSLLLGADLAARVRALHAPDR
jgi:hypothetical protein